MRVLLITQDFPPQVGGIQTFSHELALRLSRWCEEFEVIAPVFAGDAAFDAGLSFRLNRIRSSTDALVARGIPTLWRRAREGRFDVALHAQWGTGPGALMARRFGWPRRVFVIAHGRELLLRPLARFAPAQKAYDALRRRVLRGADGVFTNSEYTAGLVKELGVDRPGIEVVGCGVDAARFDVPDADERARRFRERHDLVGRPCFVTVTRLHAYKGVDTAIAALPSLRGKIPDATYVVVGNGPDLPRLREMAASLGVAGHVRFLGEASGDEVVDALHACDALAMLSRLEPPDVEGFGLVFLEAGACGRPVVGARTGGIPEVIVDGQTGLLVPPGDPAATADALARIMSDPTLARRLGEAGRHRARNELTWDRTARAVFEAMRASLEARPAPAERSRTGAR